MKKYDRKAIFSKMWSLTKNYNMNTSEALGKAWKMAKLEILENEYFLLKTKDLTGGKTNIVAQNMIREYREELDTLSQKVIALKKEIYPTVAITETIIENPMTEVEKEIIIKRLTEAKKAMETANYRDKLGYETIIQKLKTQIENSNKEKIYTSEKLDLNAYDAA